MITAKYDRLASFLYAVLRDEVTIGRVTQILREIRREKPDDTVHYYGNDHLARFVLGVAEWLHTGEGELETMLSELEEIASKQECRCDP